MADDVLINKAAVIEVEGKKQTLEMGQHFESAASTSSRNAVTLAADTRGHFVADAQLRRRTPRLLVAALAMGAVMYFLNDLFTPYVLGTSIQRWTAMLVLVATGGVVYAAGVFATGAIRLRDIRQLVRSR